MHDCLSKILNNEALPSPPTVAAEILDLVAQSDSTIDQITRVISADPKLASRLISYCNSPIVGTKREIGSLPQAVVVLGLRTLRLISLSFSLLETKDDGGFDYDDFWRRSLATAIASQIVGERSNGNSQESFLQGLVLNVGEIGLANTFPTQYGSLNTGADKCVSIDDEFDAFGLHRYQVGSAMLAQWCFPDNMVQSVGEYDPRVVHHRSKPFILAQRFAQMMISDSVTSREVDETKKLASEWFDIDLVAFAEMFDRMIKHWQSYQLLFGFGSIPFDSYGQLEAIAKKRLLEMAMKMESEMGLATKEIQQLQRTALIDVLTKLKNRHAYDAEVPGVVDYHRRQKKSFGILVIDIDHFKTINDTYGHAAGDAVLQAVGQCLQQKCRKYDTVYRYGGEEFVAMIVDCNQPSIENIANRFREAIEELKVVFDQQLIKITASVGIGWVENGKIDSIDELFRTADSNLYQAKNSGRNCCVVRDHSPMSMIHH